MISICYLLSFSKISNLVTVLSKYQPKYFLYFSISLLFTIGYPQTSGSSQTRGRGVVRRLRRGQNPEQVTHIGYHLLTSLWCSHLPHSTLHLHQLTVGDGHRASVAFLAVVQKCTALHASEVSFATPESVFHL